jgi:hypothetical protein
LIASWSPSIDGALLSTGTSILLYIIDSSGVRPEWVEPHRVAIFRRSDPVRSVDYRAPLRTGPQFG